MSLKQRAVQCSGYIPASQYVPVYSRPHRTNQARWHEEIAPMTPKPTFDDPYIGRTQSIHEAVKQWLDSSPNSVIGPRYRSRSPSSGSPPSNGDVVEPKTPRRPDTPPWASNTDRFYDAGNQRGSPRQVSIEQSTALHSGSSLSSPSPAERSDARQWDNTVTNGAQDVAGTSALPTTQKTGGKSPEHVLPEEEDRKSSSSSRGNDAVPANSPKESSAADQVLSQEKELPAQAEEVRRGGRKRPITELKSPDHEDSSGTSGSPCEFTSRAASREFDNALALVVREIEKQSPSDSVSSASYSSLGAPEILLKPPRGQKKNMPRDTTESLAHATVSPSPQAGNVREAQNAAVLRSSPPLTRSTSAREGRHEAVMGSPSFHQAIGPADDTIRFGGEPTTSSTAEIVPAKVSEIVESVDEEEIVSEGKQKAFPTNATEQRKPGYRASLQKIDESLLEEPKKRNDGPRVTLRAVLEHEKKLSAEQKAHRAAGLSLMKPTENVAAGAQQSKTRSSDLPEIVSNGQQSKTQVTDSPVVILNGQQSHLKSSESPVIISNGQHSQLKSSESPLIISNGQHSQLMSTDSPVIISNGKQSRTKASDSPVIIANGVAAVAGVYEFRVERPNGRTRSSQSPGGGSGRSTRASTPNNVPQQQYMYKVSPLHQMARKTNRSRTAVSPAAQAEAEPQLRRDRSSRSTRSTDTRTTSPKIEALDKAKMEELRVKAEAWENAKNVTILNRYKREESKIHAWEERKVAKAAVFFSKTETDWERKKSKALEKMQYDVEQAHKKAAEMKAHAEAKRVERAAKAAVQAQVLRVLGKSRLSCFCR